MNFESLKEMGTKALSGSGSSNTTQQPQGQNTQQTTGTNTNTNTQDGQDYGDKAFDFIEKKTGKDFGAGTDEKITDGLRGAYEKATGSKVDPKYSN